MGKIIIREPSHCNLQFDDKCILGIYPIGRHIFSNEAKGIVHGVHTGRFDIDEDCLPHGVALQVQKMLNLLVPKR